MKFGFHSPIILKNIKIMLYMFEWLFLKMLNLESISKTIWLCRRENNWFIGYLYKKTKKEAINCYQFYSIGFNVYERIFILNNIHLKLWKDVWNTDCSSFYFKTEMFISESFSHHVMTRSQCLISFEVLFIVLDSLVYQ